jgi:glycosyltransferase involved in cell wall biosynthesis
MKNNNKLIIFMPSMDGGGVEKNIIIISNYLSKYIKKIYLITYDNRYNKFFDRNIKIINIKKKSYKNINKYKKYFFCLIELLKLFIKKRNVSVFTFQANIYAITLCKLFGVKVISRSNSSPAGWNKNFFKNLLFGIFFKLSNKIIVNSYAFKKQIDNKFNINSKMIYNPLNKKEILEKSKYKCKQKIFFNKKIFKIICVARFTDQKDHQTLLKAFKIISSIINAKLVLIGFGSNENKIKKFLIDHNLERKVIIIKEKFNPYKYIAKSDILVLSSLYEGLPNVLLEALTLKRYVIASNCPTGPKEILENGKYGSLFKMKNYIELSRLILNYYNHPNKYKKIIENGYKSLDKFDYTSNCKKYLSEVKKILN